jgi:hypothetical protein
MNSRHWFLDGRLRFDATVSNDHCFTTVLNKPDLMYSADVKEPSHSSLFIPDFDPLAVASSYIVQCPSPSPASAHTSRRQPAPRQNITAPSPSSNSKG